MASITLPTAATINEISTTSDYSQKSNLGTAATGSFLILVVWDNESYLSLDSETDISRFDYDSFAGNVLWFMDELVGIESDWTKDVKPAPTDDNPFPTAYGYVQFTDDTVATAVQLYFNHIENLRRIRLFNDVDRGWAPYGIAPDQKLEIPKFIQRLNSAIIGDLILFSYNPYY